MENKNQKIGVSQKAIIFDGNGKTLTIRRSKTSPTRPFYWDLPGGILDFGEDAKEAIMREIKEETDLEVKNLSIIDVATWHEGDSYWVTICYSAQPIDTKVTLSYEHDDFKWVSPAEFQQLTALETHKKFIENFDALQYGKH